MFWLVNRVGQLNVSVGANEGARHSNLRQICILKSEAESAQVRNLEASHLR